MNVCATPAWFINHSLYYKFVYATEHLILCREVTLNRVSLRENSRVCQVCKVLTSAAVYSVVWLIILWRQYTWTSCRVTTVWIKHAMKIVAAMVKTIMAAMVMKVIMTTIRMIEIIMAAVVVSAMW
jgi:hypothetical protein